MEILLACLVGVLPAVVLVFYIYLMDKNQREPIPWILKAVWYGVLCAIPAVLIEEVLVHAPIPENTLPRALYDAFVVAALSEESMKLLFLWLLLRKNPYFDERMDCIVYATCVSMGFAGLENIFYLLDNMDDLASVAITRALLSVPGHFFYGVFMGYFMSLYFWGKSGRRNQNLVLILLAPVVLHGIYDACLMAMPLSEEVMGLALMVFLALGIYVWVGGHRHIMRVLARDRKEAYFSNPLHNEGQYNKDERYSGAAEEQPAPDGEEQATVSDILQALRTAKEDEPQNEEQYEEETIESPANRGLFSQPFSFEGRIGRKEFIYSYLIYIVWYRTIKVLGDGAEISEGVAVFVLVSFVPIMWFIIAQCCKRCHDLGHSGWWQLIPFYSLFLLFQEGDPEPNEYGDAVR